MMNRVRVRKPAPGEQGMFRLLLVISVSYWYCLPLVTQSLLGYNEFRGYDFLFLILIVLLTTRYRAKAAQFFKNDIAGKWLIRFCTWATATLPVTATISIMNGKAIWTMVTVIFLFHLWGFALVYAAIRMFLRTRAQCFLFLDVFLVIGTIEALLICLQGVGALPGFWGKLYAAYGPRSFSATLGPNRTMPGHVMVLVITIAATYWRNVKTVGATRLFIASLAGITSLAALGVSGSRTAWSTFGMFCIVSLIGQRLQIGLIVFVALVAISASMLLPDSVEETIAQQYDWKMTTKLAAVDEDASALDKFQSVDSGRYILWGKGIGTLIEYPWLIPFGGGFNNYHQLGEGGSAHNVYITLVTEVGLVGLYLYLMWLFYAWREASNAVAAAKKLEKHRKVFFPWDVRPLIAALLFSLFAGEILYPYRPCFSFMGMFLVVIAVMNHRALVLDVKSAPVGRARKLARLRRPRYAQPIQEPAASGTLA